MSIRQLINDNSINKNKLVHSKHGWLTYSSLVLAGLSVPVIAQISSHASANADTVSSVKTTAVAQDNNASQSQTKAAQSNQSAPANTSDSLANDNSVKINSDYASMDNQNSQMKSSNANAQVSDKQVTPAVNSQAKQAVDSDSADKVAASAAKEKAVSQPAKQVAPNNSAQANTQVKQVVAPKSNANAQVTTKKVVAPAQNQVISNNSVQNNQVSNSQSNEIASPEYKTAVTKLSSKLMSFGPQMNKQVTSNNEAMAVAAIERKNTELAAQAIKVNINYQDSTGKTVGTASLTTTDGSFDPTKNVPNGYQIKSGWSMGDTPVSNGQITVNVPVVKETASSSTTPGGVVNVSGNPVKPSVTTKPDQNIVVTINYQNGGKTIKSASVTVPNGANVSTQVQSNLPSGYQVQNGWSVSNMPVQDGKATLNVPVVSESSSNPNTVDGSNVKPSTDNEIHATINYQYNGQTIASQNITVPNGTNIDVDSGVPDGYQVQNGWKSGDIKVVDGKATLNVPVVKKNASANDGKVAVTVNYQENGKTIKSIVQNVANGGNVDINAGVPQGYEIQPGFSGGSINNITDGKATMNIPVQKVPATTPSSDNSSNSSSSSASQSKPATDTSSSSSSANKPSTSTPSQSTSNGSSSADKPAASTSDDSHKSQQPASNPNDVNHGPATTTPSDSSSSSSNSSNKPASDSSDKNSSSSSSSANKPAATTPDKGSTTNTPTTPDDGTGTVGDNGSSKDQVDNKPAGTGSVVDNGSGQSSKGTQEANGKDPDNPAGQKPVDEDKNNTDANSDKTTSDVNADKNKDEGSTTKPSIVAPDDGNGTTSDNGSTKGQITSEPNGTGSSVNNGSGKPSKGTQIAGDVGPDKSSSTTSEPQGVNSDSKPGSLNSNNADVSKTNGSETDESKPSEQPSLTAPKDKNDATNADIYPGEGIIPGSNGQQVSSLNGMTPYPKTNDNNGSQTGSALASSAANAKKQVLANSSVVASNGSQTGSASQVSVPEVSPVMSNAASQSGSITKSQVGSASSGELPQTGDDSVMAELGLLSASLLGLSALGFEKKHE